MRSYSRSHLTDGDLLRTLAARLAQDCGTTAELLADLAEVDARKLYLPAAYPSMFEFCVGEFHMSEDAACRRIRVARAARQFPTILEAVAAGRLHLTAVLMLAPHLTPETIDELVATAAHKNKSQLEQLLARRFPRPDVPTQIKAISPSPTSGAGQPSPGTLGVLAAGSGDHRAPELSALARIAPRPKVVPLAPERFALQVTIPKSTHDLLRHAQELLSHSIPSGDVAEVLDRALRALVSQLEKRNFGAVAKPRRSRHPSPNGRHVPVHVRREVWKRDQGQCTFVSASGHRCEARKFLEFDHIDPVARGGKATVERMRLRCRSHNQYAAECALGVDFMRNKRREAQRAATMRRAAAEQAQEPDVVPWLRRLGFRNDEVRRAAAQCETLPDATLEDRLRFALSFLGPPHRRVEKKSDSPSE